MTTTPLTDLLPLFPRPLASLLAAVPPDVAERLEEIRLGVGRPLLLVLDTGDAFLNKAGQLTRRLEEAATVEATVFAELVGRMTKWSVYAFEEELRLGFLTLPGGHRVGLAGRGVIRDGRLSLLRDLSSCNIRLAREVRGAADSVLPQLVQAGRLLSTLICSPPRSGKTTLLRDLCRQISQGRPEIGLPGRRVVLIDERSELAAMVNGQPQAEIGPRTDVLDGVPKAQGLMMAIRALSPEVVVSDELGRPEDTEAVLEALRAGVAVLTSAHAADVHDVASRPSTAPLLRAGAFQRLVLLSRARGPGTVEAVLDGEGRPLPSLATGRPGTAVECRRGTWPRRGGGAEAQASS